MRIPLILILTLLVFFHHSGFSQRTRPASPRAAADSASGGAKEDDDEDEEDEDESDGGDPFARYARSKLRDQNCDPTILEGFYQKFNQLSCLVTNAGICVSPGREEFAWAIAGGLGGAVTSMRTATATRTAAQMRVAEFQASDRLIRSAAEIIGKTSAGPAAEEALLKAKPMLLARTERAAAQTLGGIALRNGSRGLIFGFLGGGAIGIAMMAADISLTYGLSSTACAEFHENDPNFRKYVPIQKGTCHTPIYNAGAPQAREFLRLPLAEKLKVLDANPRICGFYRSLNEEMDVQIASLEGSRAVSSVSCDSATGDITFKTRNNANRTMIIKRKPGTQIPSTYQYREFATADSWVHGADFNLVQTENGTDLTQMVSYRNGPTGISRRIPYEDFSKFATDDPTRAQTLLYAFRTTRTHAKTLMECCDMSAADLSKPANQEKCPPSWFPARTLLTAPIPPERPKTLH